MCCSLFHHCKCFFTYLHTHKPPLRLGLFPNNGPPPYWQPTGREHHTYPIKGGNLFPISFVIAEYSDFYSIR